MRFYTGQECRDWLEGRGRQQPGTTPGIHKEHVWYPQTPGRVLYFAHWVATELSAFRKETLLWIINPLILPSFSNWHLYYKLRSSYGEPRLWHEAPGHLFLDYETEDLATFLQITMLSQWDAYLLTADGDINAEFSHDEHVCFYAENEANLESVRRDLVPDSVPPNH